MTASKLTLLHVVFQAIILTVCLAENEDGFCELSDLNKSAEDCKTITSPCLNYDKEKFKTSPSIFTYFPEGRLGNKITAYLTLLWLKLDFGLDVYYEKESFENLDYYFENVKGTVKILEDSLCNWKDFGFEKYEGDIEKLGLPEWSQGKAVQLYIDKKNFMRHEIQGGRKYVKEYRVESLHALTPRPRFRDHAVNTLRDIAKQVGKSPDQLTYVAIHNRRTDYLEFRRKRLGLKNLYKDYFDDAMDYFNEEYANVVFIYTSDDMDWGRKKLSKSKNIFFVGCGDGDEMECVGNDFALLSSCNHTITTHGSFGTWSSIIAGGEIYTEYGAIVP